MNIVHGHSKQLQVIITQKPGPRCVYDFDSVYPVEGPRPGWEVKMTLRNKFTGPLGKPLAFYAKKISFILTQVLDLTDEVHRFHHAMLAE